MILPQKNQGVESFNQHLQQGGFPDYLKYNKSDILQELFNDIVLRDIVVRHKLRSPQVIKEMALYHFPLHLYILHKLHLARDPHHVSDFAFRVEEADFHFGVDFKLLVDIFAGVDAVVEAGFVGGEKLQARTFGWSPSKVAKKLIGLSVYKLENFVQFHNNRQSSNSSGDYRFFLSRRAGGLAVLDYCLIPVRFPSLAE